jgi:hypothetical protein
LSLSLVNFFASVSSFLLFSSVLEQQIQVIKKTSESPLESLKKVGSVESELEEVRYEASFAGVQSTKEHKKQLAETLTKLKQIREKTEGMELLEQKVVAGIFLFQNQKKMHLFLILFAILKLFWIL